MKINFNANQLTQPLSISTKIIGGKTPMPILQSVMFTYVSETKFNITSSDGEIWLSIDINDVECDPFEKICVNASDLLKALGNLGEERISVSLDAEKYLASFDYGVGYFTLPYTSAEEFPMPKQSNNEKTLHEINSQELRNAIDNVLYATAIDELRPILRGVYFEFKENTLTTVATNCNKLVKCTHVIDNKAETSGFTISAKPLSVVSSIISQGQYPIDIETCDNIIIIKSNVFNLTCRVIDGNYPNYERIIPRNFLFSVNIQKSILVGALKRTIAMSDMQTRIVTFVFEDNKLSIVAEDVDFCKSAKEVVNCEHNQESFKIAFNGVELLSILQNMNTDSIEMNFTTERTAAVITPTSGENIVSLIMPYAI